MTEHDFRAPDRFTAGTVGEPGQRIFYLQVTEGDRTATFRLEKQQVAALADSIADLLVDLAEPTDEPADVGLVEPVVPEWVVGALGVGYDDVDDRILIAAQEFQPVDDPEAAEEVGVDALLEPDPDLGAARVVLTREQAAAFVHHARSLVEAGRPPCPFCGRPLDPAGHACPRMN
jgi:uncharacterized repeat protein (TIGR03847 family)